MEGSSLTDPTADHEKVQREHQQPTASLLPFEVPADISSLIGTNNATGLFPLLDDQQASFSVWQQEDQNEADKAAAGVVPSTPPLDIDWVSLLYGGGPKFGSSDQQASSSSAASGLVDSINVDNNNMGGGPGGSGRTAKIATSTAPSATAGVGGSSKGRSSRAKKIVPPRFAFHTRSDEDVLDDGYKWRKYGQKAVKNSKHPRSYYRCTYHTCNVKKQIQRLSKDTRIVVTTYEGIHNHPSEKLMETLAPLLKQLQFLSRF